MRYLAIDLGDKRTGLALGDDETRIASPVGLIEVPSHAGGGVEQFRAVAKAVAEHLGADATREPGEVLLGLPLHADGRESDRSRAARDFAARLTRATGRVVHLVDERRTSLAAESRLNQSGLTHKQKKLRRDAIAAAELLRTFLSQQAAGADGADGAEPPVAGSSGAGSTEAGSTEPGSNEAGSNEAGVPPSGAPAAGHAPGVSGGGAGGASSPGQARAASARW